MRSWSGRINFGIGGVCAVLGLVVLLGWCLHVPRLIQLRPNLAPMQFNTALCTAFAGMALALRASRKLPMAGTTLASAVAGLGGLTLGEYLFGFNLGIDQLLFRSYITTETSHLGRMSPVSSVCFTLIGFSLLIIFLCEKVPWGPMAVGSFASITISISVVALLGYALGLPGTYGWGQLTRMAMHTAAAVGLLGTGIFIVAWDVGRARGEPTPRWLPVPLTLGVFTGSLVLYFALDSREDLETARTVKAGAESAKNQIQVRMEARIRSLVRMAKRWEFSGDPQQPRWEADAADYVQDLPDTQAVEWIDATGRIRWVVPLAGNEGQLNLDITGEVHRHFALSLAEHDGQPAVTRTVTLFHGGIGFIVYVPLVVNGESRGCLGATFNAKSCLDRYLPPAVAAGEAIRLADGGQTFYERDTGAAPTRDEWVVEDQIELHGATWNLRVWPTSTLAARLDSRLPEAVLCGGVLGSLLLGAVCFFAQRASRQATEAARANVELRSALDQVHTLEGLLPMCSACKRVRDDAGYWSQVDLYIRRHTRASVTHGYCPECAVEAFKQFGLAVPPEIQEELEAHKFD